MQESSHSVQSINFPSSPDMERCSSTRGYSIPSSTVSTPRPSLTSIATITAMRSTTTPRIQPKSTSRPPTAPMSGNRRSTVPNVRSSTAGSMMGEGGLYIVAVLQSKGPGVEVGLAAINIDTGRMILTQVADSPSFTKTLHYLALHPPSTILVTDTQLMGAGLGSFSRPSMTKGDNSTMVERIEEEWQIPCQSVSRQHWNSDNGMELIKRLCIEDELKASVLMVAADRYYALCASSALLMWTVAKQGVDFRDFTVKIQYETMKGQMFIDSETAKNLELVQNNLTMKSNNTLFSTLNSCLTPMGIRLLRSAILQPSNQKTIVENRLDAVEELMSNSAKLSYVRKILKSLDKVDIDGLITKLTQQRRSAPSTQQTEYRIATLLQLRNIVKVGPELAAVFYESNASVLNVAARMLSDTRLLQLAQLIDDRITDDVTLQKARGSRGQAVKHAKLFAIKKDYNQMLDIARSTYQENLADIMDLIKQTQNDYEINVTLEWGETGFRFMCRPEDLTEKELPPEFKGVEKGKRSVRFTSGELLKRNARMLQTQQEVFFMSDAIVSDLVNDVVKQISCLYTCSEAVALIDMLASFAYNSAGHQNVRPLFCRALAIKGGRHPILESTLPAGDYVANDVYAADGPANFQLIQGPNMSGKSTYLRQIGLLTVQALVGSFVPAEYATFPLHDALLSRLSNDDYMEKSLSTFAAEMATSAMILGLATSQSLILIDELGRGTSPIEGMGISHAIAEQLIKIKSFVFFATHFQDLAQTLCTLPGVVTLHLRIHNNSHLTAEHEFSTTFHYKVIEGACKEVHYGLELAKLAALPQDAMDTAREVATKLSELEESGRNSSLTNAIAMRRKVMLELRGKLQQVVETSRHEDPDVVVYLRKLQHDVVTTLRSALRLEERSIAS